MLRVETAAGPINTYMFAQTLTQV